MYERIEGVMKRLSGSPKTSTTPRGKTHAADMHTLSESVGSAGYDVELGYLEFAGRRSRKP